MTITTLWAGWYFFILGSCIGSFLNVCIYRIPENLSVIKPGSFCPNCKNKIQFYYNIPILSYIVLKGRCGYCKTPISIRYPLIELLTGLFAFFLYYRFSSGPELFFWLVFICALITISFIDIDHQIIPDVISLPGIIIFSSSFYFLPDMTLKNVGLGILIGGGSLYLVGQAYYLIKKQEGMGGGDMKLLAMIGAATGVKGVLFTIFCGSILGTFCGLFIMIFTKILNMQLKIPFGPFLSVGVTIYIFFGNDLIDWYVSLLRM